MNNHLVISAQAFASLVAFDLQGLCYAIIAFGLLGLAKSYFGALPSYLVAISMGTGVALLGYIAFWIYFFSPAWGRIFSWVTLAYGVIQLIRPRAGKPVRLSESETCRVFLFAAVIGMGAIGLTCLFDAGSFSFLSANRFIPGLPSDNQIPAMFAERLWNGQSPRHLWGDWLSSDRPPLQTGWILLTRPLMAVLRLNNDTSATASGVWFQLLWVPALWALLRRLGATQTHAAGIIAAVSFTGVSLIYTIFTWPKYAAAALVLGAFLIRHPDTLFKLPSNWIPTSAVESTPNILQF